MAKIIGRVKWDLLSYQAEAKKVCREATCRKKMGEGKLHRQQDCWQKKYYFRSRSGGLAC